ncbi:hypothetical protein P5E70_04570 [Clostridium perfringens]|uniref:ABC-three component system middle component 6 n=1 Tax=Clostridium perfringens TaxID=1502 RepID=UPI0011227085|nr:ABC-three component system middle component 6 [Clostridium perfringens]MDK0737912.1 hypothetical protein [Clostridium perfringens]TPE21337.1 hypothetical protein FJM09_07960 [Clostridium perfringens]CAJ1764260.1 hypothetical protein AUSP0016_00042 [uncultured phage]CAJ1890197.1 hypothetical protein AUSP0015_00042 [uncultured phage]
MILPSKHVKLSESLIGLGAFIIELLNNEPMSLEDSWERFNKEYIDTEIIRKKHNIDTYIDAIMLLYMVGAIEINDKEELICI